jgi:cytoskeleton protein RodZ
VEAGQQLFEARQRRGLTLDDISRTTKIPISLLQAIENNDGTRLPQAFFRRTFVRAYAKEVGLAAESLVESLDTSEFELLPKQPQAAIMPVDDRAASRSFLGVVALCAACIAYVGFWRQSGTPTTPQIAVEHVAQPLPVKAVDSAAPPPCVAAPLVPSTVRAAHRPPTPESTQPIVATGTTEIPVVKHVIADDLPVSAPATEAPATTPEPVETPADQNPASTPAPAAQL